MIRFHYTVSDDREWPRQSDAAVTDPTFSTVLKSFGDELRQRMLELDAQSAVTVTEQGLTSIQSTIRPDMVDEVVQRRAARYHLVAKLKTVA
jgi:hypothetical protein